MSIVAGRIDYRLLHGIVQGFWCPTYATQRTMIIDDATANDEVRKAAMKLSKPSGQALSIITEEKALTNFKAGKYDNHTVFTIARDPQTFLDLIEAGQKIPVLTLGLTELPPRGHPGRPSGAPRLHQGGGHPGLSEDRSLWDQGRGPLYDHRQTCAHLRVHLVVRKGDRRGSQRTSVCPACHPCGFPYG